jgi:hypothetical protein
MKNILYLLLIFNVASFASDEDVNSYWNKAVEQTDVLWNKTKDVTLNTFNGAKNVTINGIDATKGLLSKGKQVLLEKTLLTAINLGLDYNNTIVVNQLTINDLNSSLSLVVKLEGEDKELLIDMQNFDWDISVDKNFIILENIDVTLDIPWLDYLAKKYLKQHNGYIKVKYSLAKETFLHSLKERINTTYGSSNELKISVATPDIENILATNKENLFVIIFKSFYDEVFVKANYIKQVENGLAVNFSLAGSKDDLNVNITQFDWATANDKQLIVLGNIEVEKCTKPWIESLLHKNHEQIIFDYRDDLNTILTKIKPKTQGSFEHIKR